MDGTAKKTTRKRLADLLVEAGVVTADELPRGLEYAQKAADGDWELVAGLKELIDVQGLSVQTALRALLIAKQKHCNLQDALITIGWRPRVPAAAEGAPAGRTSMFDPSELDAIGSKRPAAQNSTPGLAAGLKASGAIASGQTTTGSRLNAWRPDNAANAGSDTTPAVDSEPGERRFDDAAHMQPVLDPDINGQINLPPVSSASKQIPTPPPLPVNNQAGIGLDALPPQAVLPQITELVYSGDRAYGEHAYDQAEGYYLRALGALERSPQVNDLSVAEVLVKLGRACMQQSEFGRAEAHLIRALKIREIVLGHDDIVTAECLDHLAELFDVQSQYLEAEHFYLTALGVKEKVLRPGDSEIVRSLKKLVAVSKHRGTHPDEKLAGQILTEAGLIDASKLQEGLSVASQQALPIGRALISLNYLTETDLQSVLQAQLLLREGVIPGYLAVRALRIASEQRSDFQTALREIGLEPEKADTKGAFALLAVAQELASAESKLDLKHPDIAVLCMKLGDLYVEHQRHQQAEALYRRALRVLEPNPQAPCEQLRDACARIGHLFFRIGRYEDAEDAFTKLIDLLESRQQDHDLAFFSALESLAAVHYVRGNYQEAGRLYQLCLTSKERLLSADHPGLGTSLQGRANCYYASERFPEAEKLYRRAKNINNQIFGANNEANAAICNVLGDLHYRLGQFEPAQIEYTSGLDCLSNSANPDVWLFSRMLQRTANCYMQLGDLFKAEVYFNHFLQARQNMGTADSLDIAETLENYAAVLQELGRLDDSQAMAQRAQAARQAHHH